MLGLGNVRKKYGFEFSQTWVWLSLFLTLGALAMFIGVVAPAQASAVSDLESGRDPAARLPVIAATSGVASLMLAAVVFLMIYKPGL